MYDIAWNNNEYKNDNAMACKHGTEFCEEESRPSGVRMPNLLELC